VTADLERLRAQGKFAIWLACRPPERPFRADFLASASRAALFWGLGGPLNPLSVETILLRSGLATGVLTLPTQSPKKVWGAAMAEHVDQARESQDELTRELCASSDASTANERLQS
jgi:hypothetical protein